MIKNHDWKLALIIVLLSQLLILIQNVSVVKTDINCPHEKNCELVVENCQYSDEEGNDLICYYCKEGYALNEDQNKCIEFPKCEEVNNENKCTKCRTDDNEYLSANKEGKCVIDFCDEYDDDWECEKCNKYFYLDEGKCNYINIPYCKKVNEDDKDKCNKYADFIKDPSQDINQNKKEYETRCYQRNTDGTCQQCYDGYVKDESGINCIIKGCKEYQSPSPRCEFCEYGYILVDDETKCMKVSDVGSDTNDSNSEEYFKVFLYINLFLLLILL